MTRVLITGANGFIARHLAPTLHAAGMEVVGTSRQGRPLAGFGRIAACSLGDSLASVLANERPDAIVHTALDAGPNAYEVNVDGTRRWLEEATSAGTGLQVFLSTLSALPDPQGALSPRAAWVGSALSDYGRAKYDLERDFRAAGGVIFRMGIVVGRGGMFARMVESARRYPIVPLLDGGRQLVYVLGIDFLCAVIRDGIAANGKGLTGRGWNLQQPQPTTLRQVIEAICRGYGYRRLLLPIPARPVLEVARLAERLSLPKLPISSANIEGLLRQGRQEIPSDFARFGFPEQSLDALIAAAVRM